MVNKPHPCEGLNIRIPIIISIKGRGVINQGSGLGLAVVTVHGDSTKLYTWAQHSSRKGVGLRV